MDEETRSALELTKDELLAMRDAGERGTVAKRPRDLNQLARSIVDEATESPAAHGLAVASADLTSVKIDSLSLVSGTVTIGPVSEVSVSP